MMVWPAQRAKNTSAFFKAWNCSDTYKQHKASLTVSGAVWVIVQPHSNPVLVCDPCGGTWPLFSWKEIQHQQWHAHWEAENYMTIPLSRHRHLPCVCAHDRKYFKAGVAKPRGRNHSPPCWTRRLSSINKRRRCSKHQSSKMMHQYVSGCTRSNTRCSSFQLWLC